MMKKKVALFNTTVILPFMFFFSSTSFAQSYIESGSIKSLTKENDDNKHKIEVLDSTLISLKQELNKLKQQGFEKFINTSIYLDAAIGTYNNLNTLIYKESYRNKIASLNNPTSKELGFSLEFEIRNAIKPLLEKAKHVNENKFTDVLSSLVGKGAKSTSLFAAGNVFSSVVSMVGNLVVKEKKVTKEDFDGFINTIEKYFTQYEKLYLTNVQFSSDIEKLKSRLKYIGDDIKSLQLDIILASDKTQQRNSLKSKGIEDLMLQHLDATKLRQRIDAVPIGYKWEYPADAIKTSKDVFNNLQRLYEEYQTLYKTNYTEIKNIITETKSVSKSIDQAQMNKTLKDLETLYNESKEVDANNLRFKTLAEKLEQLTKN